MSHFKIALAAMMFVVTGFVTADDHLENATSGKERPAGVFAIESKELGKVYFFELNDVAERATTKEAKAALMVDTKKALSPLIKGKEKSNETGTLVASMDLGSAEVASVDDHLNSTPACGWYGWGGGWGWGRGWGWGHGWGWGGVGWGGGWGMWGVGCGGCGGWWW